jgi:serine/threonine protein kinase
VLERLSRNRVLDVFDAWCEPRRCRVVVKTLRPERLGDRRARAALLREGRLLRRIAHPHVVRAYEVHERPRPLVVLETLTGETLAHLLERRRPSAADVAQLGLQLCSAAGELHRHGLLHLDLKPANVVVENGRAVVIDLSVARRPGKGRRGVGTWCYLAPEQAAGAELGPAADVWGIGMTLWEASVGERPFPDDDARDHPQTEERVPPVGRRRSLPAPLAAAIDACLEPDPRDRPSLEALWGGLLAVPGGRSPLALEQPR